MLPEEVRRRPIVFLADPTANTRMSTVATRPVEQLTQDTGLIVTVSAAANSGQHTALMRLPTTAHRRKSTLLLTVSVIGTMKTNQSIELAKTMTPGVKSGIVATEESLLANEAVVSTSTLNALDREPMALKGLKHTRNITGTHTPIHLIKNPRIVSPIVIGSTEKNLSLRSDVREAVSALLQIGCAADRTTPTASAPTATDSTNSRQSDLIREAEPRMRESKPQATVLIALEVLHIGTGQMRRLRRRIFVMCAED